MFSFSLSLFLLLHCYNIPLMRTFRRLGVSPNGFNQFKNGKSQQVILNMKNAILSDYLYAIVVVCRRSVLPPLKMKKKWLQVFLYTINSCHSCNSFLYLRFPFSINNFRATVLHEFFSHSVLLDRQPAKPRRKRTSKKIHFC